VDTDGDGYGDPASPLCTHPERDCDDTDEAVNPSADEVCGDAVDNNCDGLTDGEDSVACPDDPGNGADDGCGCQGSAGSSPCALGWMLLLLGLALIWVVRRP
jgi:MYXO-CTERM domain-containing protein